MKSTSTHLFASSLLFGLELMSALTAPPIRSQESFSFADNFGDGIIAPQYHLSSTPDISITEQGGMLWTEGFSSARLFFDNNQIATVGIALNTFQVLLQGITHFQQAGSVLAEFDDFQAGGQTCPPPVCINPPSGLVSWWPGDGNADDFEDGNGGTLQNGAAFTAGLVDQAFLLNAGLNSGIQIPASSSLNPSQITLEAWIKPFSYPNPYPKVLVRDTDGLGSTQYLLAITDGAQAHCNIGQFAGPVAGAVPLHAWTHLACTYDLQAVRLYVNGVEVASVPATQPIPTSSRELWIGNEEGRIDFNRQFDGLIDEVSIYNRALSAAEIQSIYNAGSAGKCKECTPPEVSIIGNDPVFTGATHSYTANTDASNPSFEWSVTGGVINGSNSNNSVSITAGAVGAMMVSVNVTDGVTNCSHAETKSVTVDPPSAGSAEVVFATNSIWLKEHAKILSGNVVVNEASSGPVLDSQVELSVGQGVTTSAGFALKANRIKVKQGATVASDIYQNELTNNGTISGSQNSPLALPVFASLPPFHQAPSGMQDITVNPDESITLTAGAYRDILIKQNGTILFAGGGSFALRSLNTGAKAKLLFDSPTEILIGGKLDTDENSYVGPQDGSGIGAADIVFYVAGSNDNNGNFGATPKAAQLGLKNTVLANFYVPNGTLWLRQGTVATGAFLSRDVIVGEQVQVTLESAFDGGSLPKLANNESSQEQHASPTIPASFALLQNCPNPFNPTTVISFALPEAGVMQLTIYNLHGQEVRKLIDGQMHAGFHTINWNGRDEHGQIVPSGVYLYKLQGNGFALTRKMIFMK